MTHSVSEFTIITLTDDVVLVKPNHLHPIQRTRQQFFAVLQRTCQPDPTHHICNWSGKIYDSFYTRHSKPNLAGFQHAIRWAFACLRDESLVPSIRWASVPWSPDAEAPIAPGAEADSR